MAKISSSSPEGRPAGEPRCWSRDASGLPVTRPRPGRGFPAKSAAGATKAAAVEKVPVPGDERLWRPSRGFFWKLSSANLLAKLANKKSSKI